MAGVIVTVHESDEDRATRLHEHLAKGAAVKLRKVEDGAVITLLEGRVLGLSKRRLHDYPGWVELRTKQ